MIAMKRLCGSCSKCISCGSPDVADFSKWPITEESEVSAPFCNHCLDLHNKNNFCPVCFSCYEEDDFTLKMMECVKCHQWIHSQCEGITDEFYEILSCLPDSVDYVCCLCSGDSSSWVEPIRQEFHSNLSCLIQSFIDNGFTQDKLNKCGLNKMCLPLCKSSVIPLSNTIVFSKVPCSTPLKQNVCPKVSKDIDDDCVSSDESSYSESDSDLESTDEEEDPKYFEDVKRNLEKGCYKALLEVHVDVKRIIANARFENDSGKEDCFELYKSQLKELFPWFNPLNARVFDLVNKKCVVPVANPDHNYLLSKDAYRRSHSKYWSTVNKRSPCKKDIIDQRKCVFCSILGDGDWNEEGRLLYYGQDEWIHINCSLWSSEVYEDENGRLQNIAVAITRGKQIKCSLCQERGATLGCCQKSCGVTYHFPCAKKSQCIFMKDKRMFCSQHSEGKDEILTEFYVKRSIVIDLQAERKRWKPANKDDVHVNIGSLAVKNLGSIEPGIDTEEALIPSGYTCSRLYWSTINPFKRVWYSCRIKVLPPDILQPIMPLSEYNETIDHSDDSDIVNEKFTKVGDWHASLSNDFSNNTPLNLPVPPHLCPFYQKILKQEKAQRDALEHQSEGVMSMIMKNLTCHTTESQDTFADIDNLAVDDLVGFLNASAESEFDVPQDSGLERMDSDQRKVQVCKVLPMSVVNKVPDEVCAKNSSKLCMKRNYKTVIKNYACENDTDNTPIKTLQIEINETIELPQQSPTRKSVKRQLASFLNSDTQFSSMKENQSTRRDKERSKNVVKISDDMNNITVILDNKSRRRKKKFNCRRKSVLQVDGAADFSSSEDDRRSDVQKISSSLIHHIKQQSLARSAPGTEGPTKCSKCKRSYRTKDSFLKHSETCNFEIDSSSSSEENFESTEPLKMAPDLTVNKMTEVQTQSPTEALEKLTDQLIPPMKRPVNYSGVVSYPAAKRTPTPKSYTNVKLVKGGRGYQLKRTVKPQVNTVPYAQHQFMPPSYQAPQIATVVSGPSVALPPGYTLQYVGSFRGDQVTQPVMTPYNPMVMSQPVVVAPPMIPQVLDTTYVAPTGYIYNQPVPNVQYIQQPTSTMTVQNIVQQPILLQQTFQQPQPSSEPIVTTQNNPVVESGSFVKPQAVVPPQRVPEKPNVRPIFSKTSTQRSVATVAPAVFTTSKTVASSNLKPRPTYSYRDAMKCTESAEPSAPEKVQSFKITVKKDSQDKYNIEPTIPTEIALNSPEIKEVRIKAKVSVGPKRRKHKLPTGGQDVFLAPKDINKDPYANEMEPNVCFNLTPNNNDELREQPAPSSQPRIVFELTSDDGFKVESKYIGNVWQKVFDAVSEARESVKIENHQYSGPPKSTGHLSGLNMLGLTNNAVKYLLEQLPDAKSCQKYSFKFQQQPEQKKSTGLNLSGCIRTEPFRKRRPYDLFSWLASKHRRIPEKSTTPQEDCLPLARRATSLELPMAMRYRHLCETAREAVGVFRSEIHGRGLFCKRDIESGEMVIEYAGQVIRSSLCDIREKMYESKGIGCYMFRIDEFTVVDATLNGNAARFINHSCDPNCFSRVVDILGSKHILIFALRKIFRSEELTYDYKFPIEDIKIPCSCGTKKCRKYLN